jgi:hypothetical protein
MRVEQLRKESSGGRSRVAANVVWEKRNAPPQTLVIESSDAFESDLEPSPDGFLLALLPVAQWEGEERILIEGRICSRLSDGLVSAMALFHLWCPRCVPLRIDATDGFAPTVPRDERRAASFLSGGVDALALLRTNRLEYPVDHPGYIRDCILLFGMNTYDLDGIGTPRPGRLAAFDENARRMAALTESVGATLIPIHTNIRGFHSEYRSWARIGFGAGMAGVAHCLSRRMDRVEIASAGVGVNHDLVGSHPSLDHSFSTEAVTVFHAQTGLSRFEKTRIVAEWPEGLAVMRPCFYRTIPRQGHINCGQCEKCIRTMLTLLALGKLDGPPTFPFRELTAEQIEPLLIERDQDVMYYEQIIGPLIAAGRLDLVEPVRRRIREYKSRERRKRVVNLAKRAAFWSRY